MGKGTGGAPQGRDSLGLNLPLLRGQEFTAHFRERRAQLGDFARPFRRNGIGVVAPGKRANSGDEVVEWLKSWGTPEERPAPVPRKR